MNRALFGKYDAVLLAALLVVAGLIFVFTRGKPGASCEIAVNGEVVQIVDLSAADTVFALPENPHIRLEIRDHAIAFIESDCPDKVCVRAGFLARAGQSAVCLPNKVSIYVSDQGSDVDVIAK